MVNKETIKKAGFWSALEAFSSILLSALSVIFLARILHPDDYGKIAAAQAIATLLTLILGLGLTEAVIQKKDLTESHKQSVFWGCIALSGIAVVISVGIGICLYHIYDSKIIPIILGFETAGTALTIASILPTALLLKNLEMKAFARRTLIARVMFFAVAIPMALKGYGLWSVVIGNLIQVTLSSILIYTSARKLIPRGFYFNRNDFIDISKFGLYIMIENLLWNVLSRVFGLLILSFHGTYALGLFNMASRLTDAILNVLNTIISRMALPIFSSIQDDRERLIGAFKKITLLFNLVSMPAFIGIAITCNDWSPIILGTKWNDAIPIIQIIATMNAVMFSRIFVGAVMKAVGQSKRFLYLSASSALVTLTTALATFKLSLVQTMTIWSTARILITIPIGIYLMQKIISIKALEQIRPVIIPAIGTSVMYIALFINDQYAFNDIFEPIPQFLFEATIGMLFYAITIFFLLKSDYAKK